MKKVYFAFLAAILLSATSHAQDDVSPYGSISSHRNSSNNYTDLFLGGAIKDNGDGTFTVAGDGGSNYFSAIRMDNGGQNVGGINFYNGTTTGGSGYTLSNVDLSGYMKMTIVGN